MLDPKVLVEMLDKLVEQCIKALVARLCQRGQFVDHHDFFGVQLIEAGEGDFGEVTEDKGH